MTVLPLAGAAWSQTPASAPAPSAEEPQPSDDREAEITGIPFPAPEGLEEAVQMQLREEHSAVAALVERGDASPAERSAAYGKLGQLFHTYELEDAAEASYFQAHRSAPGEFRWLYYLGLLYQQNGKLPEAVDYYERALAVRPSDLAALVHLGEVHLAANDLEKAEARLRSALGTAPSSPAALASLGQIALARGEHQQAVEYLTSALELVPAADRLHYSLGMAYRGLRDMEKAREHLGRAGMVGVTVRDPLADELKQLTEGERIHLLRGRTAFAAGRFGDAAEEFDLAVKADPKSARARVNLGTALARTGDVEGAIDHYRMALELDPESSAAHYNLGALRARQGRTDEALRHFTEVLVIDPEDPQGHVELAALLRRGGKSTDALTHYAEAVRIDPRSEAARLGEAVVLVDMGRFREARDRLEAAYALMPGAGRIAYALARILGLCPDQSLRDGDRALDLALRVFEARSTVEHAVTVARILAELERCEEAAEWQRGALKAAEEAGQEALVREFREAVARYESGPPCGLSGPPP
ncbi:MAG: tetratricopeptide repeat protein [bacterium]|nr:tetratricopeptide repeat protein [bacterium]